MKKKADPVYLRRQVLVKNTTFAYFLSLALLASALVTLYLLVQSKTLQQYSLFFGGTKSADSFMDFFNVIKYVSTKDPYHYTEVAGLGEKAYPPLAYLFLYPFTKLFDYIGNSASAAKGSQLGLMSLMMFFGVAFLFLALTLYSNKKGANLLKTLCVVAMLSSGVYLYTVERANLILWAAPLLGIFLFWYKSESPVKRELAYLALACATGFKIFPVIFGILILKEKRWFAAIRTMIYGAVAVFLPFLFFKGGFSNFSQMLDNAKLNTLAYQFQSSTYRLGFLPYYLSSHAETTDYQFYISLGNVLLVLAVIFVLAYKSQWKAAALLTCAIIATPTNSAYYCGIYLFVPIILFLNEEKHSIFDWVYIFLFFLILSPYQYASVDGDTFTGIFANYALLILYVFLLAEAMYHTFRYIIIRFNKRTPAVGQME